MPKSGQLQNSIVNMDFIKGIDVANSYVILENDFGVLNMGPRIKKKFLQDFLRC